MVFISYAREDIEHALALYDQLVSNDIDVWLDLKSLLPGENWESAIKNAIKKCTYFIAILSNKSLNKRGFVQKELYYALEVLKEIPKGEIFLIPARVDLCFPKDEEIKQFTWVDLFPTQQEGISKILSVVGRNAANTFQNRISSRHTSWHSHKYLSVIKKWSFTPNLNNS